MTSRSILTLNDHSNEKTTATFTGATLSSANFDAQQTANTALRAAVQALTLGNTYRHALGNETQVTTLPATDPFAQREMKWLISYADTVTGKEYQLELGTADLADGHLIAGSDEADLSHADWVAFETAFEAFQVAPDTGNAVAFTGARFVGRKS